MPRNSGGTYTRLSNSFSEPVAGTTVSPTDASALFDELEAEVTDSLCRSGKGAMLAALPLADGSAAAPGLTFGADSDTGLYRIGANAMGVSAGGALRATWAAAGVTLAGGYTLTADSVAISGGTIGGITDLAVADGGTGASSAAAARSNLGLAIGSDVQAFHARLADIAGLAYAQGDVLYHNGSGLTRLAAGASGQFLKTQGAGANPVWSNLTGGGDLLAANNLSDVASAAAAFGNIKQAASESATGVVELATNAEAEAGTDTARAVTPAGLKAAINANTEAFTFALSDETSDLATGTAKVTWRAPYALENVTLRASVSTAPTGSTILVDINKNGSTMMTTNKLSIDASEKTSVTAATPHGMTITTIADDDEITFDIDQVGSSTKGKGLKVTLYGNRP
jgi:hypothetical protein